MDVAVVVGAGPKQQQVAWWPLGMGCSQILQEIPDGSRVFLPARKLVKYFLLADHQYLQSVLSPVKVGQSARL